MKALASVLTQSVRGRVVRVVASVALLMLVGCTVDAVKDSDSVTEEQ